MEKELEKFGLSNIEIKTYLALLRQCPCSAGPLIKTTGFQSSSTYFALERLREKGLVSYAIEGKKRKYKTEPPERFKELLENQEKELNNRKDLLSRLIPALTKMQSLPSESQEITVFEGFNGVKTAFNKALNAINKSDCSKVIVAWTSQPVEPIESFFIGLNKRRAQKGVKQKVLVTQAMLPVLKERFKKAKAEKVTQIQLLPENFITPTAINIYADYILLAIWSEKPIIIMIKSKVVASGFNHYFDSMWKNVKAKF